jgi:FkbM family methyltransferase
MSVIGIVQVPSILRREHAVTRSTKLEVETSRTSTSSAMRRQAIRTTISNTNPRMEFEMLLFPESVDKVVTRKLQQNPITYERDVTLFLQHAFHEYSVQNQAVVGTHNNNTNPTHHRVWAADLGANVGYHTLYMASLGGSVIALEPAPDTYELLLGSLALNPAFSDRVVVIPAGASDSHSQGRLARHADSPGMTTLVATDGLPWAFHAVDGGLSSDEQTGTTKSSSASPSRTSGSKIPLLPVEEVFAKYGLPERGPGTVASHPTEHLWIAKVDCEGWELRAFRGFNLRRYPFRYLLFEFFPQLIEAGGSDPIELLQFVFSHGYRCIDSWVDEVGFAKPTIGESLEELQRWVGTIHSHVNLFCSLDQ